MRLRRVGSSGNLECAREGGVHRGIVVERFNVEAKERERVGRTPVLEQASRDLLKVVGRSGDAIGKARFEGSEPSERRGDAFLFHSLDRRIVTMRSIDVGIPAGD